MLINYTNKDNLELYIRDNIVEINRKISQFKIDPEDNPNGAIYSDLDIKQFLKKKLVEELPNNQDELVEEFRNHNYVKARAKDMACAHVYYYKDLLVVLEGAIFNELKQNYSDDMVKRVVDAIFVDSNISEKGKKFLNKTITGLTKKTLILLLQQGFLVNLNNIDSGVMTANAGDSAQFLFVSRAILAGFNCSNVDVRSSRYDAVIDYKKKIFRVQVKGISGETISFKDRDRGGLGIDTHHERNIGKRITAEDCDIYVAVDKQVGMCYIIPMKDIDPWDDDDIDSVNVSQLEEYRENWDIISELYE